ncbi:alpha-16-mannosyltransferase mnn11-related [Anaeramoeba ignava]|uniref:Alpha-16-mannosyltransferase mnn11-related n=1 Tax=Anaeramoeba ignava TaxID=1746090 RepID=A0A9Q0LBF7_ANAIG|nr:alpha-16-mannosyltransferase mnn11-related [Anaeramoeba ignava]
MRYILSKFPRFIVPFLIFLFGILLSLIYRIPNKQEKIKEKMNEKIELNSNYSKEEKKANEKSSENLFDTKKDQEKEGKKPKICILMVDDRKLKYNNYKDKNRDIPYHSLSVYNNYLYAQRYGYDFLRMDISDMKNNPEYFPSQFHEPSLIPRAPHWNKLPSLYYLMTKLDYDIVMYLDSDAIFFEFEKSIEDFISENAKNTENISLIVTRDIDSSKDYVNTGVMIFFNNDFTIQMLIDWYNMPLNHPELEFCINQWGYDQSALGRFMYNKDPWKQRILILSLYTMNSNYGKFVRHFWGGFETERRADLRNCVLINICQNSHLAYYDDILNLNLDPTVYLFDYVTYRRMILDSRKKKVE